MTVAEESVRSGDPAEVVASNVAFINTLNAAGVPAQAMHPDALRSYYADYYQDQMVNGGFSQLVYNSRWGPPLVALIREGLAAIDAPAHSQLFERGAAAVAALGPGRFHAFLQSGYFGENPERDALATLDDEFAATVDSEDLTVRNGRWLLARPGLRVIPNAEFAEVARRHAAGAEAE